MKKDAQFIGLTLLLAVSAASLLAARVKEGDRRVETKTGEEQCVVIRTKPQFVEEHGTKWLVLPQAGGESLKVYSSVTSLPDTELEFNLWSSRRVLWRSADGEEHAVQEHELAAVKDGRKTYFDASTCPVHHIRMTRGDVAIHYGLLAIDPKGWKTFSGGPGWVGGGCVIMEGAPTKERGYICDRCVKAYEKWSAEEQRRRERRRAKEEGSVAN